MTRIAQGWWLLLSCGLLEAALSLMNFFDGNLALRSVVHRSTVVQMGVLAMAAGVCTIAAAIWTSRNARPWLLVLNGVACGALGGVFAFWTGGLAFRTVALLIVVMALSLGIYALAAARTLRRHVRDEWLLGAAGVAAIAFAAAFLAFVFRWIPLDPGSPAQTLHWMGSYFAVSAFCMLELSLTLDGSRMAGHGLPSSTLAAG